MTSEDDLRSAIEGAAGSAYGWYLEEGGANDAFSELLAELRLALRYLQSSEASDPVAESKLRAWLMEVGSALQQPSPSAQQVTGLLPGLVTILHERVVGSSELAAALDSVESNLADDGQHLFQAAHAFATSRELDVVVPDPVERLLASMLWGIATVAEIGPLYLDSDPLDEAAGVNDDQHRLTSPTLARRSSAPLDEISQSRAAAGLEPLLEAATRLLFDSAVEGEDAAELESLRDGLQAELRNPRPDPLTMERLGSRLAAVVTSTADQNALVGRLGSELGMTSSEAQTAASQVISIVVSNGVGVVDPESDRREGQRVLDEAARTLQPVVDAAIKRSLEDPDGPLAARLDSLEQKLQRNGTSWPAGIAQGVAATALVAALSYFGVAGTALRALVWVLIAIYSIL